MNESIHKKFNNKIQIRKVSKDHMKGEIVSNPDSIKKNFIEGEINQEVTNTDGKEDAEVNVVKHIRDTYK